MSKAIETTNFIIEKVAPIFNKMGYAGTSLSDITKATGLTKGAIYGNFKDKEALALASFNYNLRRVIGRIEQQMNQHSSPVAKLRAVLNFYAQYFDYVKDFGGCPVVNIGVDANHRNPALLERVRAVVTKLQRSISKIVEAGIASGEIKKEVDASLIGRRFFLTLEGAIFLSVTMDDSIYLEDAVKQLEEMIIDFKL